jgi:hypothetical protein
MSAEIAFIYRSERARREQPLALRISSWIEVSYAVRAGYHTIPASNTRGFIYVNQAVGAFEGRSDRTDFLTGRFQAMVAEPGKKITGNPGISSVFHFGYPGTKSSQTNAIFRFA